LVTVVGQHDGAVKTRKLSTVDGFVLLDLENAPGSVGVVRSAPKILVGGAEMLARSVTYSFAVFGIPAGGASAGVNAAAGERAAAVTAFAAEVGSFEPPVLFDAGRGVRQEELAGLSATDPRSAALLAERDGIAVRDHLVATGALASAEKIGGSLTGQRVAIEGFGPVGLSLARQTVTAGATVVAVATAAGTAFQPDGFTLDTLTDAWAASEEALVKSVGTSQQPPWAIWNSRADVLFCGSKAGAMTHEGAAGLQARTVVPIGPVPITAKALAVMSKAGVTYVPDFVAIAAPLLVGIGDGENEAQTKLAEVLDQCRDRPEGLFVAACERAESFLRTWQDTLPFGRPLA
jgi:glutamate dehydrogenase (NAD(P)+)